jgi:hypothetical protein
MSQITTNFLREDSFGKLTKERKIMWKENKVIVYKSTHRFSFFLN